MSETIRNIEDFLESLNDYLEEYFNYDFELNDFQLTRIDFTSNINVGKKYVPEYIAALHKLGKVKYFKLKYDKPYLSKHSEVKETSFDLIGKTNHIGFSIYDKEADLINRKKFDLAKKETLHQTEFFCLFDKLEFCYFFFIRNSIK